MYFAQNIRYLRAKKNLSQPALADQLDITRNQISSYEDSRAEPSQETLVKFSEFFQLPIDVLIKNNLTLSKEDAYMDIGNNRLLFPIIIDENDNNQIEIVTKEASAGYLNGYSDSEYVSNLPIMNLPFLPTGKHRGFRIKGDSMSPWVNEGDYVIGEYLHDIKEVRNNFCYIILTKNDGLVYKRVNTAGVKQKFLTLVSDNKSYHPYDVHFSDILEIWQFKLNLCIGQYSADELNPKNILNLLRSVGIELADLREKMTKLENRIPATS
jgi:transcriptional regulator with XRE-family HTH domain